MENQKEANLKNIIGDNIVFLMSIYEKSRKDVASDLNISYTTLTDWIKGNTYPRMEALVELGYYFRIDVQDFFVDISKNKYQKDHLMEYAKKLGVFLRQGETKMSEEKKLLNEDYKELFRHKTLEERAEEFAGKLGPYKEMNFGEPKGREKW